MLAKIRAMKYSFQRVMKLKMVTVMIPGWARGSRMTQKVFMGPQPSMAAASSKEWEMFWKKAIMKKVVKGTLTAT